MAIIVWRVDELAAQRGWGAPQLAEETGLDQKTVRNILTGRATRVDLDTIAKLADALGVGPGSLWRREPDRRTGWEAVLGAAGPATSDELDDVLAGTWPDDSDPGLERASRTA
jgi:DNA-binding Xre family transcriptional regulator